MPKRIILGDIIQDYKLKRGYKPEIDRIKQLLEANFPGSVSSEKDDVAVSYGAIKRLKVSIVDKKLRIDTESNPSASEEEILDTNKRFRKFLDDATGYSSKQRVKMAKKEVED